MIKWLKNSAKISYSQCGEDLIVDFIFQALRITNPTYLDIGAHHPTYINNTFLFYEQGNTGLCIEPDPILFSKIKAIRKKDRHLNVGIGVNSDPKARFHIMTSTSLNTFSKEEANRYVSFGNQRIEKVIDVPLLKINDVIQEYFPRGLNFISLDVEGMDFEIIKSNNFLQNRPEVFCVETLTYTENKSEEKRRDIIEYMVENGYMIYADTYINTIFVDQKSWQDRQL